LKAVGADTDEAFEELYKRFHRRLFLFAMKKLYNEQDAMDVMQETLFRVWSKRASFDGTKKLSSWMFAIELNLCIDIMRLRQKRREVFSDKDGFLEFFGEKLHSSNSRTPEEIFFVKRKEQMILADFSRSIKNLSDRDRRIVIESLGSNSLQIISDKFEMSHDATRAVMSRAYKHIRKTLGNDYATHALF
jgi:RNA polymerase sigma factor (sigma-70 family)